MGLPDSSIDERRGGGLDDLISSLPPDTEGGAEGRHQRPELSLFTYDESLQPRARGPDSSLERMSTYPDDSTASVAFSWTVKKDVDKGIEQTLEGRSDVGYRNSRTSSTSGDDEQRNSIAGNESEIGLPGAVKIPGQGDKPAPYPGMPKAPRSPIEIRHPEAWKGHNRRLQEDVEASSKASSRFSLGTHSLIQTIQSQFSKISLSGIRQAFGDTLSSYKSSEIDRASESNVKDSNDQNRLEKLYRKAMKKGGKVFNQFDEAAAEKVQEAFIPNMTFREQDWDCNAPIGTNGGGYTKKQPDSYRKKLKSRSDRVFRRLKKEKKPDTSKLAPWHTLL